MIGFLVAATVVTLLQYLRVREKRMLPLLALFAFLALGHFCGEGDDWGRAFHFAAGLCGLLLLAVLTPRFPGGRTTPSREHAGRVKEPAS